MPQTDFDKFTDWQDTFVSPDSYPITPSDTALLPRPVRAIRANVGGQVVVVTPHSDALNMTRTLNFFDGETRMVAVTKVLSTGTTAGGLEGMP